MTEGRSRLARLFAPYGLALLAVVLSFSTGGASGGPRVVFWILHVAATLALVGWLLAVLYAFRRDRWGAVVVLPSALLCWFVTTEIPLLVGGCVVAHECV